MATHPFGDGASEAVSLRGGRTCLSAGDVVLLWLLLPAWLALFLIGTLVASAPFRAHFAAFDGGAWGTLTNGLAVLVAYTLPNIALLCIAASLLGSIGAKAYLGADTDDCTPECDTTSPRASAVLRGFVVYLTLISGVVVFAETPSEPTQSQYVKLAGVTSVIAFLVSYRPTLFGLLLQKSGKLLSGEREREGAAGAAAGKKRGEPVGV